MKQKLTKLEKYWVLYDVGNSAFTLLVSTIIPIYFKNMAQNMGVSASDSTAYLSYAISISTIIVAILGPILGAVADNKNHKKPLFTFFMMIGVLGCAGFISLCNALQIVNILISEKGRRSFPSDPSVSNFLISYL
jgi:MFS transporter, UMF1 family